MKMAKSKLLKSMVVFIFSPLEQKYPFWANLNQKIKIARLSMFAYFKYADFDLIFYFSCFGSKIPFWFHFKQYHNVNKILT